MKHIERDKKEKKKHNSSNLDNLVCRQIFYASLDCIYNKIDKISRASTKRKARTFLLGNKKVTVATAAIRIYLDIPGS